VFYLDISWGFAQVSIPRRVKKSGVKHTLMASAGARAYNGVWGGAASGGPGAEPPVGGRACSRRGFCV